MKDFKKSMDKLKKNVKCAICGIQPEEGQKIDNWFLKEQRLQLEKAREAEIANYHALHTRLHHKGGVKNIGWGGGLEDFGFSFAQICDPPSGYREEY